ncbi:MAG: HAD-IIA family hydrolase [Candidatus Dormibacteria bacterium]
MTRVAMVGLGAMGSRIAGRLLDAGHPLVVWNRSPERAASLVAQGALAADTPADAARRAAVLITMVADPGALLAVTEGRDGVGAGAGSSLLVIEMSTVGRPAIERLAGSLPAGTGLIDAPVLGSLAEAEGGSLVIFAGGSASMLDRAMPILAQLGTVIPVGGLGSGASAKLLANQTLLTTLGSLGEALALAEGMGLSRDTAFAILAATPLAAQAERRRPGLQGDGPPPRFPLSLARKDAQLISAAAASAGLDLPLTRAAEYWFTRAVSSGLGAQDYAVVLREILGSVGTAASVTHPTQTGTSEARTGPTTNYDGLIVDLDGVVWQGDGLLPGAAEAIAELRMRGTRLVFLTNEPARSREAIAERLVAFGIPASPAQIFTSGTAMARALGALELSHRTALVVGPIALQDEVRDAGFTVVPAADADQAAVVAVGAYPGFDYAQLTAAARSVRAGALLFTTSRDATFPAQGGLRPGTGAVVAAVEVASGAVASLVGKPDPAIFAMAAAELAGCRRIAVVGDHLEADIAGAQRAGLGSVLVLSGVSSSEDLGRSGIAPDLVVGDLGGLPGALFR